MGNLHGKQNPGNFSEEAQPNSEGKTEHIRRGQGSGAQETPGEYGKMPSWMTLLRVPSKLICPREGNFPYTWCETDVES